MKKHGIVWANFLHLYQPAEQQPDILEAIVAQSYRPIIEKLASNTTARMTININGCLLELFDKYGYHDLLQKLKKIAHDGRVEFTSSAKYHALLPFLNDKEIIRQVTINNDTLRHYLGEDIVFRGFFAPEMAFEQRVAPVIASLGFEWTILDEIACGGEVGKIDHKKLYRIEGTAMNAFFRDRRISNLIMSAVVRSKSSLLEVMKDDFFKDGYFITAMDGETFGHHRPGLENLLFEILDAPEFDLVQISDIKDRFSDILDIVPTAATWASSKQDIDKHIQFLSWSDPENTIHAHQWELTKFVLDKVYAMDPKDPAYPLVRKKMDIALASDHFWWASAKPWWSVEMIEEGAFHLLDVLRHIPKIDAQSLLQGQSHYEQIISTAFNWQRTGKIRKMMMEQRAVLRIPFIDRTVGKGGEERGVYEAFMEMMKGLEQDASANKEYEKAVLWRDAIYKFDHKQDIYDAVNVIDLLRLEIPHEEVESLIEKYKGKYREIRGGQPEQRGS